MGLKSTISTRQILLTCAAFTIFSYAPAAHAGFEWVPQKKKMNIETNTNADMVVQEAPVTPIASESLNAPQQQQMMVPAPNSGMIIPEENTDIQAEAEQQPEPQIQQQGGMKTMSFTKPQNAEVTHTQHEQVILPPPVQDDQLMTPPPMNTTQQAKAISVDELDQSETQIDLPTNTKAADAQINMDVAIEAEAPSTSDAPISLVPESRSEASNIQAAETYTSEPTINAPQEDMPATNMIEPFPVQSPNASTQAMAPQQPSPAFTQQMAPVPSNYEVVQGFGKNMPLALALQQIIPEDHAFSFSKNVDVGQRVEWNGGQSWDVVLRETLWPLNLDAHIDGNKVVIYSPAANMQRTSAAEMPVSPEAQAIAIEPAAGQEMASEDTVSLTDQVTLPVSEPASVPTKRSSIQDPGDVITSPPEDQSVEMKIDTIGDEISLGKQPVWEAKKGDSLKSTLYSWSEKSNMQIIWEASHDFTLDENFTHEGTSKEAFKALLDQEAANGKDINIRYVDNPQKPGHLAMVIVQDNEQAALKRQEAENNQAG